MRGYLWRFQKARGILKDMKSVRDIFEKNSINNIRVAVTQQLQVYFDISSSVVLTKIDMKE